jgi:thioredoxin 2
MVSQTEDKLRRGVFMQVVVCINCGAQNRVDEVRLANSEAKCGRCGEKLVATAGAGAQDSTPVVITDQTFEREVLLAKGRPILLDCWAPWCGPCRMIGPIMDQLAAEALGRYRIAKLNVDENPQTASRFQIASIPTMLIFKDGKLIDRLIGAQPKQVIADRLQLASSFAA